MFKLSEIKELIKLVDQTSVHELEIENEGTRLLIRKPGKTEVVNVQAAPITHTYAPAPLQAQHSRLQLRSLKPCKRLHQLVLQQIICIKSFRRW